MTKEKARLWCVDDEASVLEGLERLLRRECDRTAALDGRRALEFIKTQPAFEVVISDMRMPGMDGMQLYHLIREINSSYIKKLIFITGDLLNDETERFLMDTRIPCIEKPFTVEEILKAVHKILCLHPRKNNDETSTRAGASSKKL